jgi:hypothetical protein
MKKIFFLFTCLILCLGFLKAQQSPAVQLSEKIAQKLRDTLDLTSIQKNKIYDINMLLHNQKMAVRLQYVNQPDSMTRYIQRVEKTRDSLYRIELPLSKYNLYLQKKRNLVNNN